MKFPEWTARLPRDEAERIKREARHVSDGGHEKGCFWRGYELAGRFYIGLCSFSDVWEVDESTLRDHCGDDHLIHVAE